MPTLLYLIKEGDMSVKRWAFIAFGLFVLAAWGLPPELCLVGPPRVMRSRTVRHHLYTYNSSGVFSFE